MDELTFILHSSDQITKVLWKFGKDKIIEFDPNFGKNTYGNFMNRAHLNDTTGILTITNLTTEDSGTYSVEINNVLQTETYSLKVYGK